MQKTILMTFFLAENCVCSNANDMIEEKLDAAKNIALNQEHQANDNSNQGLIGSILGHLGGFLKSALSAALIFGLSLILSLPKALASALQGLLENGLIGLFHGLISRLNVESRKTTAKAVYSSLIGERNTWNFICFVHGFN